MRCLQLIDYLSMKIFLVVALLVGLAWAEVCVEPQRSFYMSYPTLSKRDTIANLFEQMSNQTTVIDSNYTDNNLQANFRIIGLRPHVYYNDHHQTDSYVDKYTANVSMGVITVSSFFNFSVSYSDKNTTGTMRIRGFLDPSYFTKSLVLTDGYLEWKPAVVSSLTFSQDFHIEYTSPNITESEQNIFLKMLNNQAGIRRIRDQITIEINTLYIPLLEKHLNHEDLINSNNITYQYRNISIKLDNMAKSFELSNANTKGLEVFLIFGSENSTENCTKLPTEFDQQEYGGLQQLYTLSSIRAILRQAVDKGLFDVTVDKSWDVPGFQFYMGDLSNSVPFANYAPANDPFTANCKFNRSRIEKSFKMIRYGEHQIYLSLPESCTINYNNKDILFIDMDISLVVRIVGQKDYLRVVMESNGIFGFSAVSLDQKYQVASEYIAKYSISEVLKGLVNKETFGNKFPIITRRYPVARVLDDKIIIFDPSEY